MTETALKTPYQIEKEQRDQAIYDDYHRLIAVPGAMPTAIYGKLMEKYTIHSRATVWQILKRVERRLNQKKS